MILPTCKLVYERKPRDRRNMTSQLLRQYHPKYHSGKKSKSMKSWSLEKLDFPLQFFPFILLLKPALSSIIFTAKYFVYPNRGIELATQRKHSLL